MHKKTQRQNRHKVFGIFIGLVVVMAILLFRPFNTQSFISHPQLKTNYDAVVSEISQIQKQEIPEINPLCSTQLLTHGKKTAKVIVFLHGYTNCPQQISVLGSKFFDLGYNVYVPRQPHHGLKDRLTTDIQFLTAEEMVKFTDEILDQAHGLGTEVILVGLSGGGTMAAWAAQNRPDLDRAVIVAPMLSIFDEEWQEVPLINIVRLLPNFFRWWDSTLKGDYAGPSYAYPRYATHSLNEILRLGFGVWEKAKTSPLQGKSVLVVTNASDTAVNNKVTSELVGLWNKQTPGKIATYEFSKDLNLTEHDLIDPHQPKQQINVVYPILIGLIDK